MREEVKNWLEQAGKDLKAAKDNINIHNYNLSSFLCQQAVEKALKSFLIEKTNKFPKIHDLVRLGKLVNLDKELLKDCEKLTLVYTETRYPGFNTKEYTKKETKEDIKIAERILKWVEERL